MLIRHQIIPPELHKEIDSKSHNTPAGHQSHTATSPKPQNTQSQMSTMPSFGQGLDEMAVQQLDLGRPMPNASQRTSEAIFRHTGSMQYSDFSGSYHAQNHFVHQNHPDSPNMHNRSPKLPSLRHMRPDKVNNGMESNYGIPFQYNDNYGYNHGNGYEPEPSHYSSPRTPMYDQVQRNHQSYGDSNGIGGIFASTQSRHLPTYDTSRGYSPSSSGYVDAEYSPHSPHPMNGAPYSNFGGPGEAGDPRSKKRRGNLPKPVTDILRGWFHEHLDNPYPSEDDKQMLIARTGLTISQVCRRPLLCRKFQLIYH